MYKTRHFFYGSRLYIKYNVNSYSSRLFSRSFQRINHELEGTLDEKTLNSEVSSTIFELSDDSRNVKSRVKELDIANALIWPRIERHPRTYSIAEFRQKWNTLTAGESANELESICVRGKLVSSRIMGARLVFLDIQQDGRSLQVVINLGSLKDLSTVSEESFQLLYHLAQRGDYISVTGCPHKTKRGELSILADSLPKIITPSLRKLPKILIDKSTKMQNRHVDLLLNRSLQQTIRIRSHILQYLRNFLLRDNFIEVQTPLLSDKASGAIARPFLTKSEVISERNLALRIAPELWLKRLIIGGFDRVFEIGPSFRNEGFDLTHNPEFTTCEFYKAFTSLEELMEITENIFSGMAKTSQNIRKSFLNDLPEIDSSFLKTPYKRIEFIPTIEAAIGEKLPDLSADTAEEDVIALFSRHNLSLTESPKLLRLLDKLSSLYIEPLCTVPTFIMHHPECMAPLAKSFLDPKSNQIVSARAEFFVNCIELANMYEEENSPIEQRRKFEVQARYRDAENNSCVDESYLSAMEWGLPPTGGWGCGVDRLVMLLTGSRRISDVLSFGGLKNVVSLGNNMNKKSFVSSYSKKNH